METPVKRKKGGFNCSVYDCTSGYRDGTSTHRLPAASNTTRNGWISFINNSYPVHYPSFKPTESSRICSKHFPSPSFQHIPDIKHLVDGSPQFRLRPGSVPGLQQQQQQQQFLPAVSIITGLWGGSR